MRIMHVAESAKGGVGSYLSYSLPYQVSALGRSNVRLVAPAQHRDQIGLLPDGVVTTFDRPGRTVTSLRAMAQAVSSQVDSFQPEVIHTHSTFAGLVVRAMYGMRRRRPAIAYCPHGWSFNMQAAAWKMSAMATAERTMANACDCVIAISRFEAEEAHRIGIEARKVRLVTSGIPEAPDTAPAPWDDTRLKVLFVGRLDRQKGVDVLLAAVAPLDERVCVRVAGASVADGAAIEAPPNVEMLGWLNPPDATAAQLQAADVVVVPSRWEGFGLVAAEAMRAGKPVIASSVGGLRELVDDGVTGRLVPPDSVEALRAALLMDDLPALRAMGEEGRQRYLAGFTATRMNDQLLGIYSQLFRNRQPAAASADLQVAQVMARTVAQQG